MSETTPKSESAYSATRTAPAPTEGRSTGSVTSRKTRRRERPSPRAASSSAGSMRRSAAAASRYTYG